MSAAPPGEIGAELVPRPLHTSKRTDMSAALAFAWRSPSVRSVLLANVVIGLFMFNFATFFASISSLTFGQPSLFGVAESVNAVTSLIAGIMFALSSASDQAAGGTGQHRPR